MDEKTLKARLVVIGGGGSGLAAAVTAMQKGVSPIVVLEKSHFLGGNSRMAGGYLFAAETKEQIESGQVLTRDEAFRTILQKNQYRVDPHILRAYVDNAYPTVQWITSLGIEYRGDGTSPCCYMVEGKHPFGNFVKVTRKMAQMLRDAGNTVLVDTGVTSIEKDADGKVCAVCAETADGGKLRVETESAIITTGGFVGNSELLHKYFPHDYDDCFHHDALPLDGSGIAVAETAEAKMNDYCVIIKENAYSCESYNGAPNRGAHNPMSLWVNSLGERFADESDTRNESANLLVSQPGKIGFALFDENILEETGKNAAFIPGPPMGDLKAMLLEERRRGDQWVCIADSLEEIAAWIGCDYEDLKKTVDEYNEDCDKGRDRLFAKDPRFLKPIAQGPFYAQKFRPILIDTIGPIVVNEKMEVRGKNNKPIPGLYAAGVCTAGWQGTDYHVWGSALGYAMTSGHIAGQSIAEYLL